ncbi:MAG: hypothetical protein RBT60_08925 [Candidatus Krumholzibacteria bacterium]|jgi:hypothetical protein|nr:hypothetical protein [Candidatus Krumholzibacteria bacterium]
MLIATHGWPAGLLPLIFENLESLWADWLSARRSPEFTQAALAQLEERMLAHLDVLGLARNEALPVLRAALAAEWQATVLAGAHALLLRDDPALSRDVWDAFLAAPDPAVRPGILLAVRFGRTAALVETLRAAAAGADPAVALPAASILARNSHPVPATVLPGAHAADPDAVVRAAAWDLVAAAADAGVVVPGRNAFLSGFADPEPEVADAAWLAAAWTRQPWLLDHCRDQAANNAAALRWLAVLAAPADAPAVLAAAANAALGPGRFAALGSLGTSDAVDALLAALADPDPRAAVVAAAAFTRITGQDIASTERVALIAPGAEPVGELEVEFAPEDYLPDLDRARRWWAEARGGFAARQRYSQGVPLAGDLAGADLLACWEAHVRDRYHGAAAPLLRDLDRFPLAIESAPPSVSAAASGDLP